MKIITPKSFLLRLCILVCWASLAQAENGLQKQDIDVQLNNPWALAWLPDGRALINERNGKMRIYKNKRIIGEVTGLPEVYARGQGGLLDVALHPDFAENGWVYITYAMPHPTRSSLATTALMRFRLQGTQAVDQERLFVAQPWQSGGRHFGSRIAFDDKGHVFVSVGDRGKRGLAQDTSSHMGKVIRLHDDGRTPEDNPFVGMPNTRAEIYSYGHRNPQGMLWHKGELWLNEHGPRGGDEVNLVTKGSNYGWPVVSFGREYFSNLPVSKHTHQAGMVAPLLHWSPSIAPSGMSLVSTAFKAQGNDDATSFFVGSLKFGELVRVDVKDNKASETRFFTDNSLGRIRHISVGPDGALYLLLDESASPLVRFVPTS